MGNFKVDPIENKALQLRKELNNSLSTLNENIRAFNTVLGEAIPEAKTFGNGDLDSVSLQVTKNALKAAGKKLYTTSNSKPVAADRLLDAASQIQGADIRLDSAFPETRTANAAQRAKEDRLKNITTAYRGHSRADAAHYASEALRMSKQNIKEAIDVIEQFRNQ